MGDSDKCVPEGVKHPNIKICTLSIVLPEALCLDIKTCSILDVGSSVRNLLTCDRFIGVVQSPHLGKHHSRGEL